jgi:ribosomal protein L16/L10AE
MIDGIVVEKTSEVRYSNAKGVVVGLSAPVPAQRLLFSQPYRGDRQKMLCHFYAAHESVSQHE